jgi:hypothetical protein
LNFVGSLLTALVRIEIFLHILTLTRCKTDF